MKGLALGIGTFSNLIENDYLYVDKLSIFIKLLNQVKSIFYLVLVVLVSLFLFLHLKNFLREIRNYLKVCISMISGTGIKSIVLFTLI